MQVEFIAADPRNKARTTMEYVMSQGTDQLVIATGFCSAAGVSLLLAQVERLKSKNSFVVVPSAPPTDYDELSKLHTAIPSNLFVHWGALAPYEKKAGAALMHSKVIYARSGQICWLWTGSHNFTGNATQGGNCEAAVLLQGNSEEKPFVDALKHLLACRDEASLYDPDAPPPNDVRRKDVLVLHVEGDRNLSQTLPCRVHLCLDTTEFDELLSALVSVRLFVYPQGTLSGGWQHTAPISAYSGVLTGLNLTGRNPKARSAGTTAEWNSADFNIEENNGILAITNSGPPSRTVATQAVLSIDSISDLNEALFTEKPRVEQRAVEGNKRYSTLDADMQKYFRASDVQAGGLVHIPIIGREQIIRIAEGDMRVRDTDRIRARLAGRQEIEIERDTPTENRLGRMHPFIVRAKYVLPD